MAAKKGTKESTRKQTKISELKWRAVVDAPRIYTNAISARVSVADIVLRLGFVTQGDARELYIEEVGSVALSPQHAKLLARVLDKQISSYESDFGEINVGDS